MRLIIEVLSRLAISDAIRFVYFRSIDHPRRHCLLRQASNPCLIPRGLINQRLTLRFAYHAEVERKEKYGDNNNYLHIISIVKAQGDLSITRADNDQVISSTASPSERSITAEQLQSGEGRLKSSRPHPKAGDFFQILLRRVLILMLRGKASHRIISFDLFYLTATWIALGIIVVTLPTVRSYAVLR